MKMERVRPGFSLFISIGLPPPIRTGLGISKGPLLYSQVQFESIWTGHLWSKSRLN